MTEEEINDVEAQAKSELLESKQGEDEVKLIEKINPNKDLIPQRVKVPGIGYIDMIGTEERNRTMESMKTMVFKIMNLAFAIDSIDIENGTFVAKLLNYSPLIVPEEIKVESQEQ
jgi:hypothetical protein